MSSSSPTSSSSTKSLTQDEAKHVQEQTTMAMKHMQELVESANATMGITTTSSSSTTSCSSTVSKTNNSTTPTTTTTGPTSTSGATTHLKSYGSIHPEQTFDSSSDLEFDNNDGFLLHNHSKPKSCLTKMAELLGL